MHHLRGDTSNWSAGATRMTVPEEEHDTSGPAARSRARRSEWLRTLGAVVGMLGIYFVVPFGEDDDPLPLVVATVLSVGMALALAIMISRRIVRVLEGSSSEGVPGLLTVLVLVVVAFAAAYFLLARADPDQLAGLHTRLDALYFTLSTLVTVGYGDVHPAGQVARAVACLQFAFNAIFVAGLVRAIFHQAQAKRSAKGS